MPTLLKVVGKLPNQTSSLVLMVASAAAIVASLLVGTLSDRIGRRMTFRIVGIANLVLLPTLFLAMPISWKGTLAQYVGRLHRDHVGKREVVVYDYVDAHVPVLARMASRRQVGYRALGYRLRSRNTVTTERPASRGDAPHISGGDDRRPSQVLDSYWIHAERRDLNSYPDHIDRGGKGMLFIKSSEIDEWWAKIRTATEDGLLGSSAKVATAKPNPNAASLDARVICVYTYDVEDREDCTRVREALRSLGVIWKIPYKTDEDTYAGKYARRGDRRISKRYE